MKYKVNDLVYFDGIEKGVGKVVAIDGAILAPYLVHSTQIVGGHDGNGYAEKQDNENNLFFMEKRLKPFTKKVGQKYKVLMDGHNNFREGDIAILTNLYEDGTSFYKTEDEEWFLHDIDHPLCEVEFYADEDSDKAIKFKDIKFNFPGDPSDSDFFEILAGTLNRDDFKQAKEEYEWSKGTKVDKER